VLLAGLIGAAAMGLIGALMAIPIAAGIKVLLAERLQARDAADADADAPGDGETAPQPGQGRSPTLPPPDSARPVNGRSRPATRDGDRPDDATPG